MQCITSLIFKSVIEKYFQSFFGRNMETVKVNESAEVDFLTSSGASSRVAVPPVPESSWYRVADPAAGAAEPGAAASRLST